MCLRQMEINSLQIKVEYEADNLPDLQAVQMMTMMFYKE